MRIALAGLASLAVAMGIGRFAFTPLLPMMQGDSGLSLIAGGWLAAANHLGYLFGALSAGFFRRSGGVIRLGLLLVAGTTLAMGITLPPAVRATRGWSARCWALVVSDGASACGESMPAACSAAMARAEVACAALFGWAWPSLGAAGAASTLAASVFSLPRPDRRGWALR